MVLDKGQALYTSWLESSRVLCSWWTVARLRHLKLSFRLHEKLSRPYRRTYGRHLPSSLKGVISHLSILYWGTFVGLRYGRRFTSFVAVISFMNSTHQ